ncbi:MAG: DUF433 domain-containing protein [Planctomycetes bacterium]|nr:DUF433 domain-containing protein [Planctomycetota bacterium]
MGIVRRRFDASEDTVSFLELMELLFIRQFRHEEVSLQTIRTAAVVASRKFKTDYPFAVKKFDTDGKTIFGTLVKQVKDGEQEVIEDLQHGQYVFKQIVKPFFRKLEYGEQEALRYWPLFKKGRVVLDPERQFGQPIDAVTGVPTQALSDAVCAGDGQDVAAVAKWFDVPPRAVEQAILFEQSPACSISSTVA